MISYTARLRLALIFIALVPPLVAVGVAYLFTSRQAARSFQQEAAHQIERFAGFRARFETGLSEQVAGAVEAPQIQRALVALSRRPGVRVELTPMPEGLDFVELVDSAGTVLASAHRPGLVGESVEAPGPDTVFCSVEYDLNGRHAALKVVKQLAGGMRLIGGRFLDDRFLESVRPLLEAEVLLQFVDQADQALVRYEPLTLYAHDDRLEAVVLGSERAGFVVVAMFGRPPLGPNVGALITVTAVVSLFSVVIAIGLGWYLTGKAKREIDNLVEASHRIAGGDFSTPVMAYEEGQFAQLADAFTDMMGNLRRVQRELANAEKIAAWQAMGRKIAHEVKNPLTPISISVDDLRRSFQEQQPHFDRILLETTATIKAEVGRLTRLLDQFVAFARMNPPELRSLTIRPLADRLGSLYRSQIADGRVTLTFGIGDTPLLYDLDRIEQVFVNLIKNGLESSPNAKVRVHADEPGYPVFTVSDDGPGFPADVLAHQFEPRVSTKSDGFGLGLVICQRIIWDHGGQIELRNHDNGGAIICFTLRRADG